MKQNTQDVKDQNEEKEGNYSHVVDKKVKFFE